MSDGTEDAVVGDYVLRLLDECREEVKMCDSKASILFAGVAFAAALLAGPLIDETSTLRNSGNTVVTLSVVALIALGCSMLMLGFAVVPRIAHPQAGKARYFEEQAKFSDVDSLMAVVAQDALSSTDRHAQQLLVLSGIAHRKYQQLRWAMYAVCVAIAVIVVDAFVAGLQAD